MARPGRRSQAELNIVSLAPTAARPKLTAPEFLTTAERSLFTEIAAANAHLTTGDAMLLGLYVQGLTRVQKAKRTDIAAWEKAVRVVLSLATKLRLTPQSSTDPQTLGRRRKDEQKPSYLETMGNDDDDEQR